MRHTALICLLLLAAPVAFSGDLDKVLRKATKAAKDDADDAVTHNNALLRAMAKAGYTVKIEERAKGKYRVRIWLKKKLLHTEKIKNAQDGFRAVCRACFAVINRDKGTKI